MSRELWYLTRASGIVAVVLMVAALAWGFFFSARSTGTRLRPAWWLDLHNLLGGLALTFTGIHVAAAWLDSDSGIGLRQIAIPGASALDPWGIAWGVLALYSSALVVFTTWPRRLKNRTVWRVLHVSSVAGTGFALAHTYMSGTDAVRLSLRIGLVILVAVGTYAMGLRLAGLPEHRRKRRSRRNSQPAHRAASPSPERGLAE